MLGHAARGSGRWCFAAGESVFSSAVAQRLLGMLDTAAVPGRAAFPELTCANTRSWNWSRRGLGNVAIWRRLGLCPKTVRNYVSKRARHAARRRPGGGRAARPRRRPRHTVTRGRVAQDSWPRAVPALIGKGHQAVGEFWDTSMAEFPDGRVRILKLIGEGDLVGEEGVVEGTQTGPIPAPDGSEIPATGKSFSLGFATIHAVRGEVITSSYFYWDAMAMVGQLGLLPE